MGDYLHALQISAVFSQWFWHQVGAWSTLQGGRRKGLGEAVETKQVNLALPALEKSSYSWSDTLCRESQHYSALLAARRPCSGTQGVAGTGLLFAKPLPGRC